MWPDAITDPLTGGCFMPPAKRISGVVAAFTGTPLTGTDPQSVTFTDASTGSISSRSWQKSNDGGFTWVAFAGTPTATNPVESLSAGTWSIRLTATGASGVDIKTRINYVFADVSPP